VIFHTARGTNVSALKVSEIQHYVLQVQLTITDRNTALDKNNVTR